MTRRHLQNALLDGTVELPYDWNFHAERNPEDECLHGATLRFYAGQECVPIRLSRSRRALLVKLTEQSIKGKWTTAPNTAGGGGIERHWFSWLHAD